METSFSKTMFKKENENRIRSTRDLNTVEARIENTNNDTTLHEENDRTNVLNPVEVPIENTNNDILNEENDRTNDLNSVEVPIENTNNDNTLNEENDRTEDLNTVEVPIENANNDNTLNEENDRTKDLNLVEVAIENTNNDITLNEENDRTEDLNTVEVPIENANNDNTLNEENDRIHLYSSLEYLLAIYSILRGIPLYKYEKKERFKFGFRSLLNFFYSLLLLICLIGYGGHFFVCWLISVVLQSDFQDLIQVFFSTLITMGSILCFIMIFIKSQKLLDVYQRLVIMDNLLPSYERNTKKVIKYCGFIFFLFLAIDLSIIILSKNIFFVKNTEVTYAVMNNYVKLWVFHFVFSIFSFSSYTSLHAATLALCVSQLYCNLNHRIVNKLKLPSSKDITKFFEDCSEPEECLEEADVIKELEDCRLLHFKIYNLNQVISEYFSNQLFVIITVTFLFSCYTSLQVIVSMKMGANFQEYLAYFLMAISLLGRMAILSFSVDVKTDQNKKILESFASYKAFSPSDKLTFVLSRFSQQVYQLRPTMSAFGYFTIDQKFLVSMIGTLCTYVIILIQFHGSSLSNKNSIPYVAKNVSTTG